MATREEILNNAKTLSISDLEDAIFAGTVPVKDVLNEIGDGNPKAVELRTSLMNRMESEWQKAKKSNYLEDYEEFQAVYPRSQHSMELNMRKNKALPRPADLNEWKKIDMSDPVRLRDFLNHYPASKFAAEAKIRLDNALANLSEDERAWFQVDVSDTASLARFINRHPDSSHIAEAQQHLSALMEAMDADERAWRQCDHSSIDAVEAFIGSFSQSRFREEAEQQLQRLLDSLPDDERCWINTDKTDFEALENFLKEYPFSSRSEEAVAAQQKIVDSWDESDREWFTLDKNDFEAVNDYLDRYPRSSHADEAAQIIQSLDCVDDTYDDLYLKDIINNIRHDDSVMDTLQAVGRVVAGLVTDGKYTRQQICEFVCRHPNFFRPSEIKELQRRALISFGKLSQGGIRQCFIDAVRGSLTRDNFADPEPIDHISNVCTEVYFWGLPSSGKSCAIGGILSVAGNGRIARAMEREECQGYEYMCHLASNFTSTGEVGLLPAATKVVSTYEMFFNLHDDFNKVHPITLVDLAGELMRCFHLTQAGKSLNYDQQQAWDTLMSLLVSRKSANRKIHFFVIEYGAESKKYDGIGQNIYLAAVAQKIKDMKLFEHDTDAIYIMFTKVDKSGLVGPELVRELKNHINSYYLGFYNSLAQICRDYNINGGKLVCLPFTLGEVCFSDFCLFDEVPASNVVRELLVRSAGFSQNSFIKGLAK